MQASGLPVFLMATSDAEDKMPPILDAPNWAFMASGMIVRSGNMESYAYGYSTDSFAATA